MCSLFVLTDHLQERVRDFLRAGGIQVVRTALDSDEFGFLGGGEQLDLLRGVGQAVRSVFGALLICWQQAS